MPIARPTDTELQPNSRPAGYVALVHHTDALDALRAQKNQFIDTFTALPDEKMIYRYAPGKWNLLEMLGHVIDVERIMMYRALCIARGETQSLPGFEEDAYVEAAHFSDRSRESLLAAYGLQRETNLLMVSHLSEEALVHVGQANHLPFSARALVWLVAGHELHHLTVLRERYL